METDDHAVSQMRSFQHILCCPTTRAALSLVPRSELLERLSEQQRARVPPKAVGAFVSESAAVAYPIVGRIISFLERDALLLANAEVPSREDFDPQAEVVKRSVQEWYDRFGWQKNEHGLYHDTVLSSQSKPIGHGLYETLSHLSLIDHLAGGDFMLDAASGAIPHPEQQAYSWYYRYRICVDMSLTALEEAERKIGEGGFCCLADICRLPIQDASVDDIVSGYTVQHIPDSQQGSAVQELFRVLRPSGHLCVITDVRRTRWHRALVFGLRVAGKILRSLRLVRPGPYPNRLAVAGTTNPPHPLYFVTHDWSWWRRLGTELSSECSIECLRLLDKGEYERLFGQSKRAAKFLRTLESWFPKLFARASAYCLVDIRKPPDGPRGTRTFS